MTTIIQTERLRLRTWRRRDRAVYVTRFNTPAFTRWLGGPRDEAAIAASLARVVDSQAQYGFSFWVVERRSDDAMLGYCGFKMANDPGAPIDGEMEIGWGLDEAAWGQGIAREAAAACLDWAWAHTAAPRIVAATVPGNTPSWRLMERLGMARRTDLDFAHPSFPAGHALCAHIVYVMERPA